MTHASPVELHDHAYGFRPSAHVPDCAECRRHAETISAERSAIRDALLGGNAVPLRRSPAPLAGLAAAVLLLAALAWILFHPAGPKESFPAAQAPNDPLDRLIAELKGPSKERRAAAEAALKPFGEAAAARLEKEGLDPALARGVPAPGPEDAALRQKLKSQRVTIDMQNVSMTAILNHLQAVCGVRIEVDRSGGRDPDKEMISFKVADIVADGALRLMLGPRQLKYVIQGGIVFVTEGEIPSILARGRAPVRIAGASPAAPPLVVALGSEGIAAREAAESSLRRLGFAAEGALWDGLDSPDAEVRGRAGTLLRELYLPRLSNSVSPLEARLRAARYPGKGTEGSIRSQVEELSAVTGIPLVFATLKTDLSREIFPVNWPGSALDALSHLLAPENLKVVFLDRIGVITEGDAPIDRTRWDGPAWLPYEEARAVERHLADLASPDPERRKNGAAELVRLGPPALEPLLQASRLLDPAVAARALDTAARIDSWRVDVPSGSDLQTLTPAQQRIVDGSVSLRIDSVPLTDIIAALVKTSGGRSDIRAPLDRKTSLKVTDAPLGPLLKALTRPYGLDSYMVGDTVVVDTAANVRAAVAK